MVDVNGHVLTNEIDRLSSKCDLVSLDYIVAICSHISCTLVSLDAESVSTKDTMMFKSDTMLVGSKWVDKLCDHAWEWEESWNEPYAIVIYH